jgi:hypothetical protein
MAGNRCSLLGGSRQNRRHEQQEKDQVSYSHDFLSYSSLSVTPQQRDGGNFHPMTRAVPASAMPLSFQKTSEDFRSPRRFPKWNRAAGRGQLPVYCSVSAT